MKILLIDNYDSFTYILAQMFEESALCSVDILKNDVPDLVAIVNNYNKIVFSPGPGLPSESPVMFQILEKYHACKSFLGICLGHQAIAQYFGATLCNLPYPKHGKTSKLKIVYPEEYLFENIPEKSVVGRYHSWVVSKDNVPENIVITSVSEEGFVMSLTHKTFDIKGIQFHPESYMTEHGSYILKNWTKKSRF